jgi:SAM-dependent methyltransferase
MARDDARGEYVHGHHDCVIAAHAARTIATSAGFAEHLFTPGIDVLDIGCGPGTITVEIAGRVAPGEVAGIDAAQAAVDHASALADGTNLRFLVADVYELPFPDDTFDVVFAHQLLQHLAEPVRALEEARRVLRRGGHLAVRDSDYGTMVHWPHEPRIDRWLELYEAVAAHAAGDPHAGRMLPSWVAGAGFVDPVVTTSTWTYAEPATIGPWRDLWVGRLLEARLGEAALLEGLASRRELEDLADGWRAWAGAPGAFFAFLHGEVVAGKP